MVFEVLLKSIVIFYVELCSSSQAFLTCDVLNLISHC